jgi:hypothetical protein
MGDRRPVNADEWQHHNLHCDRHLQAFDHAAGQPATITRGQLGGPLAGRTGTVEDPSRPGERGQVRCHRRLLPGEPGRADHRAGQAGRDQHQTECQQPQAGTPPLPGVNRPRWDPMPG